MKVQITAQHLRAAAHCMASKDIRYYLNGVLLEFTGPTEAFIVSTDGHTLFAGRTTVEYLEGQQNAAWSLIVPADVIKGLDKKAPWYVLEALPDGRYTLGGKVFSPIDGRFQDYRRVIPTPEQITGEGAQYNPELVSKCVKAVKEWNGLKKDSNAWGFKNNGAGAGVVFGQDATTVGVVMPMNGRKADECFSHYYGLMTPTQDFKKAA